MNTQETPLERFQRKLDQVNAKRRQLDEEDQRAWEELKEARKTCPHLRGNSGMFCNMCDDCGETDF